MFRFKLHCFALRRISCLFFSATWLASCGGGSAPDTERAGADIAKPASTQASADYRTRKDAGLFLIAGGTGGPGLIDGAGKDARFDQPAGIVSGIAGSLFIADTQNHVLRRIDKNGNVSVFAGTPGKSGNADGGSTEALFAGLFALASDSAGNLYASDGHAIRKISSQGNVVTIAGTPQQSGSLNGPATLARFNGPLGVAADAAGNIYVADTGNHAIRKITPDGYVSTLAGSPGNAGLADGEAEQARFTYPGGIALDAVGNLYVVDKGNRVVRKISPDGMVSTLGAEGPLTAHSSTTPAPLLFDEPQAIAVDTQGTLYISDTSGAPQTDACASPGTVYKISATGQVSTLAGTAKVCGSADGQGTRARFNFPTGVALSSDGMLFVADTHNHTIRKISGTGLVSTLAGTARAYGHADEPGALAQFGTLNAIAVDPQGSLHVTEVGGEAAPRVALIRKIGTSGGVQTLSGKSGPGYGDGFAAQARFDNPNGLAFDALGNLYIADTNNAVIRKIAPDGAVVTLAGTAGQKGNADGQGPAARFQSPTALALDRNGNVYVSDIYRSAEGVFSGSIRKISADGAVSTLAGMHGETGNADGAGSAARFTYPAGIVVDQEGTVYVSDALAHSVRKISSGGLVTTIAGRSGESGRKDGAALDARFHYPAGLAIDETGNLYIADMLNHCVRMLSRNGEVLTLAGQDGMQGIATGDLPAVLYKPVAIAVLGPKLLALVSGGGILGLKLP